MSDKYNVSSGGTSILGLLGVLFVGLKLTGFIDWSWWAVLSPFWCIPALALLVILFVLTYTVIKVYGNKEK
jgi:hypothetical protein